jgi:hypothetical protein
LKVKTALKRSRKAAQVLAVALPLVLAAFLYWRWWQLGAIAALMLIYL